ncbi:MAG: histone deacetylase [Candidatus Lokiarchaeota archaeon]|nr:histone deacetylase [Candidatus Lokiarchaeota archaeon]MBD3201234.1 histone deacetylase [Candidatus Lokiarchaeota archaeon]
MVTGIVYDDIYLQHRIGTHVESHERLIAIMEFLKEKNLLDDKDYLLIKPRKATLDQIKYAHEESLINEVKEVSELAESTGHTQSLDMDTLVSGKTYEAGLYSVGGNLEAIDKIMSGELKNVFALVRPPGHHSNSYKCAGFCIFNNIAIGAEYLFREKGLERVAIIDWDCHHGNGTQDIFYEGSKTGEVTFFSSHQDGRTLYPGSGFINEIGKGKGKGKIINFPMPPGSAEDVIMNFFDEIVDPTLSEFKPEFILISAGFDTHWTDRLTNMGWTYQGPARYLDKIKSIAKKYADNRILITLEGGYEIDKQAKAVYNCLKVLNDDGENLIEEKLRRSDPDLLNYVDNKLIPKLKENLSNYWNCF